MFDYMKNRRYFAQVAAGVEDAGVQELAELGAENPKSAFRGVYFQASPAVLYRINYASRLVTRVIAPLAGFACPNPDQLYQTAREIPWENIFKVDQTFAVFANVARSKMDHSQYAGLKLKDAVADRFRDKFGIRPNVNTENPDVWLNLHILEDWATIGFDTSGGSLHRRGYRKASVPAPMQETLAAAVLRLAQWDGLTPLADPMCGSGTLVIEALMQTCRIPAAYLRPRFGFFLMPDFDEAVWNSVKKELDEQIREPAAEFILAGDVQPAAVGAVSQNLRLLPHGRFIKPIRRDFRKIESLNGCMIVVNPPYGVRMGKGEQPLMLMRDFGDFLKNKCKDSSAIIYFGNPDLMKHIGLRPAWKKPVRNGGLDGRLARFDLY